MRLETLLRDVHWPWFKGHVTDQHLQTHQRLEAVARERHRERIKIQGFLRMSPGLRPLVRLEQQLRDVHWPLVKGHVTDLHLQTHQRLEAIAKERNRERGRNGVTP